MLGMWQEVEMLMKWNGMECASGSVAKCDDARSTINKNNYIVKDVRFLFYYIQKLPSLLYNAVFVVLYYKPG